VNPNLPVHQGVLDIFHVKLISQRVSVGLETSLNLNSLLLVEELCGSWVIVDEPWCEEGNNKSGQTLEDENP